MKKLEILRETFWTFEVYAKIICGWILYNLIYIHIFRRQHPDEKFERISFNKWWDLIFDDIYQRLGLERKNRVS